MAVAKNGDIYWTDSSSDANIENGVYTMLANPSGRLFHFNRKTAKNTHLLDGLAFANGLALSPNEDFIVVAETLRGRLLKRNLQGVKAGTTEIFIDGLPGLPDNLTPDADGIWIPLPLAVDSGHPFLLQVLSRTPWVRKFIARCFRLIEAPFEVVERFYPNPVSKHVLHFVGHFEPTLGLSPARTTILRANWNGAIVKAYHTFDKKIVGVSHVLPVGDYLYFGSPFNRYLGRKQFPELAQPSVQAPQQQQQQQQTTTTAQPSTTTTTTTPKPVTTTTSTTTPKPTTTTQAPPPPTTTTTQAPPPPPPSTQAPPPPPPTTQAPVPTTQAPPKPAAPIVEERKDDSIPPSPEKLKVIKRGGEQGEL